MEVIKVIKRLQVPLNQLTCLMNLLSGGEGGQGYIYKDSSRDHCRWPGLGLAKGTSGGQKVLHTELRGQRQVRT